LEPAGEYARLDFGAVQAKLQTAKAAFQTWKKMPVAHRAEWAAEGLRYFKTQGAEIARDITAQMGKPIRQSENELKGFFERAEYMLGIAEETLRPEILSPKPGFERRIEHEPLGVVLIIAPWNYPLLTAVNGVITALLSGNTVLLKHSSLTPAAGEHFAKAFGRLGPCDNVLQTLATDHATVEKTIAGGGVDHVVFTGSVEAGHKIQGRCSTHFIDCNLELGGKDGAYVAEDADVAKAAEDLVDGAMYNAGQSCCGIERVYAHRRVYEAFVKRCRELVGAYVLGDPMDAATTMGPLASPKSAQGMTEQVEEARAKGAQILAGGRAVTIGKSVFFEPTLLRDVNHGMALMREENFGPILPVMAVESDDEAIRLLNDSRYGLTSVIYTRDLERANRFTREMDTGTVFLNRCDYLDPALPWTGVRDSGRGTTLSKYGFYALTRRKAIHFRLP
jgi:acyl-CoA reductase-like NAD-dependent aldehyde dehydrogenase